MDRHIAHRDRKKEGKKQPRRVADGRHWGGGPVVRAIHLPAKLPEWALQKTAVRGRERRGSPEQKRAGKFRNF